MSRIRHATESFVNTLVEGVQKLIATNTEQISILSGLQQEYNASNRVMKICNLNVNSYLQFELHINVGGDSLPITQYVSIKKNNDSHKVEVLTSNMNSVYGANVDIYKEIDGSLTAVLVTDNYCTRCNVIFTSGLYGIDVSRTTDVYTPTGTKVFNGKTDKKQLITEDEMNVLSKFAYPKTSTLSTGTILDYINARYTDGYSDFSFTISSNPIDAPEVTSNWMECWVNLGTSLIEVTVKRDWNKNSPKVYTRRITKSTMTWYDDKWSQIATTDKVDILPIAKPEYEVFSNKSCIINNVAYINFCIRLINKTDIPQTSGDKFTLPANILTRTVFNVKPCINADGYGANEYLASGYKLEGSGGCNISHNGTGIKSMIVTGVIVL